MCINDWRMGKLIRVQATSIFLGAAATVTIPANPARVGLSISCNSDGAGLGSEASVGGQRFLAMGGFTGTFSHLTLAEHGELPTKSIVVMAGGSGMTGGFTEYFAPPEYLAAGLAEFVSQYARGLR